MVEARAVAVDLGAVALTAAASAAVDLEADPVAALAVPADLAEGLADREVLIGAGAAFGDRAITDLTATATAAVVSVA